MRPGCYFEWSLAGLSKAWLCAKFFWLHKPKISLGVFQEGYEFVSWRFLSGPYMYIADMSIHVRRRYIHKCEAWIYLNFRPKISTFNNYFVLQFPYSLPPISTSPPPPPMSIFTSWCMTRTSEIKCLFTHVFIIPIVTLIWCRWLLLGGLDWG